MSVLEREASRDIGMGWGVRVRWSLAVGCGVAAAGNLFAADYRWHEGLRAFVADLVSMAVLVVAGTALTRSARGASWRAAGRQTGGLVAAAFAGSATFTPTVWVRHPALIPLLLAGVAVATVLLTGGSGVFRGSPLPWRLSLLTALAVAAATALANEVFAGMLIGRWDRLTRLTELRDGTVVAGVVLLAAAVALRWHPRNVVALLAAGFGGVYASYLLVLALWIPQPWRPTAFAVDAGQVLLALLTASVAMRPAKPRCRFR